MAGSEWLIFQHLRGLSDRGAQLDYFESAGSPLTPRSLAALNCYLRTRAVRFFESRRFDYATGRELLGPGEWARFCRMLDLRFDGRGTRQAAA